MSIWSFLSDPSNQQTLAFYGGGAALVISSLWTAYLTLRKKPKTPKPSPTHSATGRDGVTTTGNIGGNVTVTNTQLPKSLIAVALAGCALIAIGFFVAGDTTCIAGSFTGGGDINAGDITINADGAQAKC